jgi:hypothetical protein
MGLRTQEWALVYLNTGLFVFGGWQLSRKPRPSESPQGRRIAAAIMCGTLGMLLDNLPRLLGWPHGLVLTLDTIAFVPIAAALVIAIQAVRNRRTGRA